MRNARGIIVPDKKGGAHSLFRNLIMRDGGNTTSIENIEDYNALACMVRPYTEQSSIKHKRELQEGVQHDANNSGASLYYNAPQSLAAATEAAPQTARRVSNIVQVYLKLRSGLFQSGSICPVGLMNGLRLQIDTEDAARALHQPFLTGSLEGGLPTTFRPQSNIAANGLAARAAGQAATIETNITTNAQGANNPFAVGDIIYLGKSNAAGTTAVTGEIRLGYVTGFFMNGAGRLNITYLKQYASGAASPVAGDASYTAALTRLYYKVEDRQNPSLGFFGAANATDTFDQFEAGATYNISNIEMLCSSVQPPDAYVQGMMKKAMTAQGVNMDYVTSELHRFNQVNNVGLTQIQIPTLAQRAKAVMSQPIPVTAYRNMAESSFSGRADFARNYQFVKGTELVPSRQVNLERYSQVVAATGTEAGQRKNEPLHTVELQKALTNINEQVYSLQKVADSFTIARSFNKYGQVTNLADETLSLRVDYGAGSQAKVFNNYIFKLARLSIANGQVSVMG